MVKSISVKCFLRVTNIWQDGLYEPSLFHLVE